jgi:N-acetylglucosamine-6-phosphate deacetylase
MSVRFLNARLCLPDGTIESGDLRIADGRFVEPGPAAETIDATGLFLAPGFIDLHVHGALGCDAMDATPEALETICRYHATGGTTTLALTTVCASWRDIGRALDAVRAWRPLSGATGARLAGMHVEGPYFSPERRGAHLAELLRVPEPGDIDHWVRYDDVITQITLAPELPGMRELIPALVAAGLRVSGGHSDAWDEDAQAAFAAGMCQVTHTFNCMSSARRRGALRVAGLLEAALAHPDVVCEVIADGFHVSPTLLRMLWNAKGAAGVALITDATAGAGLAPGTKFLLGDVACVVGEGVAMTTDGAALAGSTCRMIDGVRTLVRDVGVPVGEAVRAATATPAAALGRSDLGRLTAGAVADCVLFGEDFRVRQTWVGGTKVFDA